MRSIEPQVQYATLEQQGETAQLGMWVFIATEVMFFGALIFGYYIYRGAYWADYRAAGHDAKVLIGGVNAAILITSSMTMVLSITSAAEGRPKWTVRFLLMTALLGLCFLGLKGYEYSLDYDEHVVPAVNFLLKPSYGEPSQLFWVFYFISTGFHALHLTIGIGLVLIMAWRAKRGAFTPAYYAPLEVVGLYWSFVDTVWIFLYPALYLMGRSAT
jgi:cytochrome c oxidase subunit 3